MSAFTFDPSSNFAFEISMSCVFEVSPFDGGWCVKICDTGEVLFFQSGGEAERQARKLAATYPGLADVRIHDRQGRRVGHVAASLDPYVVTPAVEPALQLTGPTS
jgi:hypothetical protein